MIYLACPYSDKNPAVVEQRVAIFCQIAARLIAADYVVISPLLCHLILQHVPKMPGTWAYWSNYSKALLRVCDELCVITVPGWRDSVGVQGEISIAEQAGIPVRYIDPNDPSLSATELPAN